MAELGLFVAENPVTAYHDVALGTAEPDTECPRVTVVTALPPELSGLGLIRAKDCQKRAPTKYRNRTESQICDTVLFTPNPWVDCPTKRVLVRSSDGRYLLAEMPCLTGYGRIEYKLSDLEGNHVCSWFAPIPDPPAPELPEAPPGILPGSGLGPFAGGFPFAGGGGGGLPITVSAVKVDDVLKFLGGLGGSADLAGVVKVIAALVLQGGAIKGSLDDLPPGLRQALGPYLGGLGLSLERLAPGVGGRIAQALDAQGDRNRDTAQEATAQGLGATPGIVGPTFGALVDAAGSLLGRLSDVYKSSLDALIRAVLDLFRDDIEAQAPVTPANVDRVAAAALRSALTAGSVAQLAGMGLELLHPLKNMGVQQAIGVLAQFAGFSEIARPFFGATLRYGIGLPAEHRAAAHFRSVLPSLGDVKTLAAKGLIPLSKYRDRLIFAGYPEPFPAAFADDLYAEFSPRALSAFTDGSEADRPWLARKLRGAELSPADTEKVVTALELKATQPGRTRLVGVLLDQYQRGRMERAELEAGLKGAGLSPTHRAYYLRVADLERRGYRMELVATEAATQYRNDLLGPATFRQLLVGLGFSEDEVTVRTTAADLRRGVKQVQDEERDIEAEIRALKAQGLRNATVQLRAGFLGPGQFLTVGRGMGYDRAYLQNVAELALLQGPPSSTADAPAIGLGALEETRQRIGELLAQAVQARRVERVSALISLRAVGLPNDLASVIVELAEALAGPTARDGLYGMPEGGVLGGAFGVIGEAVLGGLAGVQAPAAVVDELLKRLGIPGRSRSDLERLIRDLRDVLRGSE